MVLPLCLFSSCNGPDPDRAGDYFAPDKDLQKHDIPTFEEFKASTRVSAVEHELYLVEWDFPILSEAELRQYYDSLYAGDRAKSAVKLTPQTGPDNLQCNVNPPPANCIDDKFYSHQQLGLRYCVSNAFGTQKPNIVSSMGQAAFNWQQVANVWLQYVPSGDSACTQTSPLPAGVDFKVAPWSGGGACAFWPYSNRACVFKTLVYNTSSNFAPLTMLGVITHEIGHILGFHHEHLRADAASQQCEVYEMRFLTGWDANSVMGYPSAWGGCAIGGGNSITSNDAIGARELYGLPASWMLASTG